MWDVLKGLFADANGTDADNERDAAGKPAITLATALKRDWVELWYQPKVNLQTLHIVGAEGLVRVRHPELGILAPAAFLPGATEADMQTMTERVILSALRDWNNCAEAGAPALALAVNVPVTEFMKLPIARIVREERPGAPEWPGLVLEITEDQIIDDLEMANELAQELRAENCSLAIDDFGAGYSSLGRLRELPFSELKIDRAYITDCHIDRMKEGMLETIIALSRRFHLTTIAEGIETTRESHKLQGLGVAYGQGYLFAKPMSKDDFLTKLASANGRRYIAPPPRPWWSFGSTPRLKRYG